MTDSSKPEKRTKAELEQMVKANGGKIYQTHDAAPNTVCVADKRKLQAHVVLLVRTDRTQVL